MQLQSYTWPVQTDYLLYRQEKGIVCFINYMYKKYGSQDIIGKVFKK